MAGSKPGGGVRPFAIGHALRRLAMKAVARTFQKRVDSCVGPYQYGVGMKAGAEVLQKTCTIHLNTSEHTSMWSADVKNAHGAVEWPAIHEGVLENVPNLLPWIHAATSTSPLLECRLQDGDVLRPVMTRGLGQGCPMSSLLFPVAIHDALRATEALVRQTDGSGRVYAYQDDIDVLGHPAAMGHAARPPIDALAEKGLEFNMDKTWLWSGPAVVAETSALQTSLGCKAQAEPIVLRKTVRRSTLGQTAAGAAATVTTLTTLLRSPRQNLKLSIFSRTLNTSGREGFLYIALVRPFVPFVPFDRSFVPSLVLSFRNITISLCTSNERMNE